MLKILTIYAQNMLSFLRICALIMLKFITFLGANWLKLLLFDKITDFDKITTLEEIVRRYFGFYESTIIIYITCSYLIKN